MKAWERRCWLLGRCGWCGYLVVQLVAVRCIGAGITVCMHLETRNGRQLNSHS